MQVGVKTFDPPLATTVCAHHPAPLPKAGRSTWLRLHKSQVESSPPDPLPLTSGRKSCACNRLVHFHLHWRHPRARPSPAAPRCDDSNEIYSETRMSMSPSSQSPVSSPLPTLDPPFHSAAFTDLGRYSKGQLEKRLLHLVGISAETARGEPLMPTARISQATPNF